MKDFVAGMGVTIAICIFCVLVLDSVIRQFKSDLCSRACCKCPVVKPRLGDVK